MRILHAIQGLPIAAGTTTFVVGVANEMARGGHDVTVAVYCEPAAHDRALFLKSVNVVSIPSILVRKDGGRFDVVHIHSMWNEWLHRVAVWCRQNDVPYVCSPHGSATPWAMHYRWWKKWLAWHSYQKKDFRKAVALHVTAADEERDIRRLGLAGPVIVAPLGVTLPPLPHRKIDPGKRVFLFVSRIQQKKGLVNLVRAVASLNKRGEIGPPAVCQFRIVGPDQEGHTAELRTEAKEHGVLDCFDFAGAKYGAELADEYARADVFVLPTFSENFGVVVIDALSYGVPVITTRGAPWSEIEQFKCGWWVEVGVEPLMVALKAALDCSWEELRTMGARGRQLVESRYTWPHAADALIRGYMAQPVIATRMGLRCGESGGRT